MVGGRGRCFASGESSERWRTRGFLVGLRVSVLLGERRELVDALCEGGPTKRAGAGRRFACTLEALLLLAAMVGGWCGVVCSRVVKVYVCL